MTSHISHLDLVVWLNLSCDAAPNTISLLVCMTLKSSAFVLYVAVIDLIWCNTVVRISYWL